MAQETYNGRTIELYANSPEHKQKIVDEAKKRNCTVSKYIFSVLEAAERPRVDPVNAEELNSLREENRALRRSLAERNHENERQAQELQKLRSEAFLRPSAIATFDPDLLRVLQAGPIHGHKLLEAIGINLQDGEAVRAIMRQLELMEHHGFIAKGARGWRWLK
jgi:hypothetical protein